MKGVVRQLIAYIDIKHTTEGDTHHQSEYIYQGKSSISQKGTKGNLKVVPDHIKSSNFTDCNSHHHANVGKLPTQ